MLGAHFLQVLVLLHRPGNVTCSRCTWIDCEQYRLISKVAEEIFTLEDFICYFLQKPRKLC